MYFTEDKNSIKFSEETLAKDRTKPNLEFIYNYYSRDPLELQPNPSSGVLCYVPDLFSPAYANTDIIDDSANSTTVPATLTQQPEPTTAASISPVSPLQSGKRKRTDSAASRSELGELPSEEDNESNADSDISSELVCDTDCLQD